jgi:CMP-N-acetylneuraminic acid synthetase
VSTEDDEIAKIATDYGGDVPFRRPDELASDTAESEDVVIHALDWLASQGEQYDYVCLLQVTTPFRLADDIDTAVTKLRKAEMTSLVSVTTYDTPPAWALTMDDQDGRLEKSFDHWTPARSQEAPTLYHPNGAIFVTEVSSLRDERTFYTKDTMGYEMPSSRSLDIDEPIDLEIARALIEWRTNR